jgi:hypothetical protein
MDIGWGYTIAGGSLNRDIAKMGWRSALWGYANQGASVFRVAP